MSTRNKKKQKKPQIHKSFATIAKPESEKKAPERTTIKSFIRDGKDIFQTTVAKPKDWAFRKPSEGRGGKAERAKQIKMTSEIWKASSVQRILLNTMAGLPESKQLITCSNPSRKLTARDILYILQATHRQTSGEYEVEYNTEKRVINFVDLSYIIKSDANDETSTQTHDR